MLFISYAIHIQTKSSWANRIAFIHSANKNYLCQLVTVVTIVTVEVIERYMYNLPDFTRDKY